MSHFTVLVVGDPDIQLEPFYEQVEPPDCRLEWENHTEHLTQEWNLGKNEYGDIEKTVYESLDDYAQSYYGYNFREDIQQYGYWYNPNAKWDWYEIGGRWAGLLKLKEGGTGDTCLAKQVDWDAMEMEQRASKEKKWDIFHKHWDKNFSIEVNKGQEDSYRDWKEKNSDVVGVFPNVVCFALADNAFKEMNWVLWGLSDAEHLINKTREEYSKAKAITYAFVDANGDWYQKGEMGWWGMDDESRGTDNYDNEFWEMINNLHPDAMVSVVDCHI
jgi:hypothetical protein